MPSTSGALTMDGAEPLRIREVQCKIAAPRSGLPGLDYAINPYRGCEHACAYCYAQDVTRYELGTPWGSSVEVKVNIVQRLRKELSNGPKGVYGIGTVTDPYQPVERRYELTRGCLRVLRSHSARISILTKSDLVLRDLDLIRNWSGAEVGITIASTDDDLSSKVEPNAPPFSARLDAAAHLVDVGIDTYVMVAPLLPGVSDTEDSLTRLVEAVSEVGVRRIMWDRFNPRPLALSRLKAAASRTGIVLNMVELDTGAAKAGTILLRECSARGISLSDAF